MEKTFEVIVLNKLNNENEIFRVLGESAQKIHKTIEDSSPFFVVKAVYPVVD